MSPPQRRLPPVRRCPGCGGDHRAWSEQQFCRRCSNDGTVDDEQANRSAVADIVRERRLQRRAELDRVRNEPR